MVSSNRTGPRVDTIPECFKTKKQQILSSLSTPQTEYTDKSPKGSVDVEITDLINQINHVEGWVTTSSCAGRVSVFAEGVKTDPRNLDIGKIETKTSAGMDMARQHYEDNRNSSTRKSKIVAAGPGGKGHGGRWLFVSHEPLMELDNWKAEELYLTKLFGLQVVDSDTGPVTLPDHRQAMDTAHERNAVNLRLIRLSFSPLILHVHTASLLYAKTLLSVAINAGFRESGVQSLKALDDPEVGTMVAIRTAGLTFETVIGCVQSNEYDEEMVQPWVSEEYLRMCVRVINARFDSNVERRERLKEGLRKVLEGSRVAQQFESVDNRRTRKREEGLRKQREMREREDGCNRPQFRNETPDILEDEIILHVD